VARIGERSLATPPLGTRLMPGKQSTVAGLLRRSLDA